MDRHALAIMIPVMAVFFSGLIVLSRTTIGRALARRIGGDEGVPAMLEIELRDLRSEVDALRGELHETQERLDFTERQLASGRQVK